MVMKKNLRIVKMLFIIHTAAVLLFIFNSTAIAQSNIKRDTSFTLSSAYVKAVKEFPETRMVSKSPSGGIKINRNLVYFKSGEIELHLDLFLPAGSKDKKYPVAVIIHGGGWRSGNKEMEEQSSLYMAEMGIAAAAVEYTLSGEMLYPASVHNIKSAIRWIKEVGKEFQLDSNNIFLMGGSAGGHLALLAAVTAGNDFFDTVDGKRLHGTNVKGVINIDGVPDLTTPEESGKDTIPSKPSAVKQWLGVKYADNPELWRIASPVNHVGRSSPPVLFINSSIPRFRAGRERVISELHLHNIFSEVIEIPSSPHTFWLFNPWFEKVMLKAASFIKFISN